MIDSTWLTSFSVFAEELNFTKAAVRLHISQPALHVQIRKLADFLGIELYRKQGRNLVLTPKGRELRRYAKDQMAVFETFRAQLKSETPSHRVTLAAGTGTLLYVLGPAIAKFRKSTNVQFRILTRDAAGAYDALDHAAADAAIVAAPMAPERFASTRLIDSRMRAVFLASSPLARKRRIEATDLDGMSLILPSPDRPHRQQLERVLSSSGVSWSLGLETNGWEVMLNYARLGLGVAVVNDICEIPRGLVSRPFTGLPSIRYWWLEPKGNKPGASSALVKLRHHVSAAFSDRTNGPQTRETRA